MNGMLLYQITNGKHRVSVRECGPLRFIVRVDGEKGINIVNDLSKARQTADDRLVSLDALDKELAKRNKK